MANEALEPFGGREGVHRIVDDFYRRVEADEIMRPIYPEDLEPGREKLKLFMVQWLGGEPEYSNIYGHPRLRRRHFPFVIDERATGRWLRHMRGAMVDGGVDEAVVRKVFEALAPLSKHMVNANENVPRDPILETFMN